MQIWFEVIDKIIGSNLVLYSLFDENRKKRDIGRASRNSPKMQ
jgi:hypothetical protein